MSLILKQESASSIPTPASGKSTLFVDSTSSQLQLKQANGAVSPFPTLSTSNTQVVFNDSGNLGGSTSFVYANNTSTLTVANLSVTGTLNAGDISVSSIANGTSNVDIVGVGGNVTISVGGNANIFTTTGTGANISGTLSASGNANVGNLGTGGLITATGNIQGGNLKTTGLISATGNVTTSSVIANGSVGNGVVAGALTSGTTQGTGVRGQAYVTASADTGAAVGVRGYAIDTHSGGYNIGVLGNASGSGVGNYAFYVQNGGIGSIEQNNVVWDLADNQAAALQFNSSGKANIFGIETTDGAEGIYTQGYLNVTGNTSTGGIKTDNYYYANGSPVDFQQAGGSNTQVQFNDNDGFGGSANFTFNKSTNVLSVNGNVIGANISTGGLITATGNVTAGNLVTGGALSVTGNANIGNIGTAGLITSTGNITGGNLVTGGTATAALLTVSGNANIGNIGTAGLITATGNVTGGNLKTAGQLVSSVSIGTAPLVVTSTTQVANLNVATSGTAGTVTTAAQPNITSTGTLTSLSVSGNANIGNIGTAGLITSTGNVTAGNLVTGGALSVTGNANIGNIGTAGLITATGNVNSGNVNTTGVFATTLSATGNANVGNIGTTALVATGSGSFGANVNMNSNYINNLGTPSANSDAATKAYVDGLVSTGLYYHAAVNAATTTTLATTTGGTITYNNGTAGVNANLVTTGSFNLIDTANVQTVGTRILVKNEANAAWNGVYTWANSTTIVRSTDTDSYGTGAGDLSENDYFFVSGGNVNIGTAYVCNTAGTITFGTTNINFALFSTSQVYSNGVGLNLSGTVFSLNNTTVSAASYGGSDVVASFTVDAQGRLTAASNTVIQANAANLSGTTLKSTVVTSSLTAVGTLTSLSVSGNANIGNIGTSGLITATGNVGAGNVNTTGVFATTLSSTGNANVGNLGTAGLITATGNIGGGNINTGGVISATGNIIGGTDLYIGNGASSTSFTNPIAIFKDNGLTYVQVAVVNSTGTGSADITAYGNNGDDTQSWTDIGFTGNTFNDANYTVTAAGDGYLFVQGNASFGGNLVIATGNTGTTKDIVFATGGFLTGNIKARLYNANGTFSVTGNVTGGNVTTGGLITATGNITGGNVIATTNHVFSVATGISAAGTVQGNATAITKDFNVVSTVASGAGVILPVVAGLRMAVVNTSANALLVYPGTNGVINSQAANASYSLPAGGKLDFISTTTTQWYTLNGTYA
jgi:hypothetical protein